MKKDFIVRRSITMIEGRPHVETFSERPLIRCQDCKHYDCRTRTCLKLHIDNIESDFFCADGE